MVDLVPNEYADKHGDHDADREEDRPLDRGGAPVPSVRPQLIGRTHGPLS